MSINIVQQIDHKVQVRQVLISVSNKSGLEKLVTGLAAINPEIRIYSTGGTYSKIKEILGAKAEPILAQVSDYTGQPETQGGLVKTLDFKIYLGLLTETYNASHQSDLQRTGAVQFDLAVVNLYPFQETVSKANVSVEEARGNIDIGGPCMIRAAAKNFIRVASVVDPTDYPLLLSEMETHRGSISLDLRYALARKAFALTAEYDRAIADFFSRRSADDAKTCYAFPG